MDPGALAARARDLERWGCGMRGCGKPGRVGFWFIHRHRHEDCAIVVIRMDRCDCNFVALTGS